MNPEMHWFARSSFKDRRSTERYREPRLAAYYWNGAHAVPHSLRDISSAGAYLVTEDRWPPGTVVMITLQKSVKNADPESNRSIRVQSKVIRSGADGVGFAFVFPGTPGPRKGSASFDGADQKALIAFAQSL